MPLQTPALTANASRQEIQSHAGTVGSALGAAHPAPSPALSSRQRGRAAPPGAGDKGQLPPGRPQPLAAARGRLPVGDGAEVRLPGAGVPGLGRADTALSPRPQPVTSFSATAA